jgi:2-keto-4-pentenoate hydratase
MIGSAADEAARLLWQAWSAGTLLAQLPESVCPHDIADAYAIQDSLDAHAGARAGWKIAATGAGGRAALGVEHPLAGPLYERFAEPPGGEVAVSCQQMRTVEAEFGFAIARDLPAAGAPFGRAAILDALGAFVPAIEMPDTRYEDHRAMGAPHLVADAALAGRFVLGTPVDGYDPERLASQPLTLTTPSKGTAEGSGAKVLGDPVEAVRWLANALAEHGRHLAAGDVVITGAAVAVRDPGTGPLLADFGELGVVGVTLS